MAGLTDRAYERLGAHLLTQHGIPGARFAVWAPRAEHVVVIGDFNGWNHRANRLERKDGGIFEGFVPGVRRGALYKYHIVAPGERRFDKADPFAFRAETPPGTASVVWELDYVWQDQAWMSLRVERIALDRPVSIYEVHFGSWRRVPEEGGRPLTYREMAPLLAAYAKETGFTHVEFLPLTEFPNGGSWGYQPSGYFAPSSRYGAPQDFMHLVDYLHREGVGVILDWVPAQFAVDPHALGSFDGDRLFERDTASEWASHAFDFSRPEVKDFLISSALFWLDEYHLDGLRVDGVATMLDKDGVEFLRRLNAAVYAHFPGVQTFAEESGAFLKVSRPLHEGGLGFGYKWDLGWMHDTLEYLSHEPPFRKNHHNNLTFRQFYAYDENYVVPLSHDEVKPGFGSLQAKMPGDLWQKFANLRLLLAYMYAQPGKKLLFMGGEFGQRDEWNADRSLDWQLLGDERHARIRDLTGYLNWIYKEQPALHQLDCERAGFEWIDCCDSDGSVISFLRKARDPNDTVLTVFNFGITPRLNYRVGVPRGGFWKELLNTDSPHYGGAGFGNFGGVDASPIPWHNRLHSLNLTLPPLGGLFLKPSR